MTKLHQLDYQRSFKVLSITWYINTYFYFYYLFVRKNLSHCKVNVGAL